VHPEPIFNSEHEPIVVVVVVVVVGAVGRYECE